MGGTSYGQFGNSGGGGGSSGVSSLNSETGDVVLVAGTNVTITPSGQNITIAASGGGGTSPTFYQEQPSGLVNGSNVTYTLAHAPSADANLILWLDGIVLYQGTDYTISADTITMTTTPLSGQSLWAVYS